MMPDSGTITRIQRFSTGDGPGIRSTVFLKGCNLHCSWCHNPETISPEKGQRMFYAELCRGCGSCHSAGICPNGVLEFVGSELSPAETAGILSEDAPFYANSGGGVTFSGGEPLLQAEYVRATAVLLKEKGIHIAVDTAACTAYSAFERLNPVTDLYLVDLKGIEETACREKTGADLKLVLENIRKLTDAGKTVELRLPVIPGYSDTAEYMERAAALISALRVESVTLLPFHRLGAPKYRALGLEYEYQTVPGVERSLLERLSRAFQWQTVKF